MADRSPFNHGGEIHQERIRPTEASPIEGEWVFLLGSEVYEVVDVAVGDKITLSTTWDFTATPLGFFGIFVRISKHEDTPPTYWKFTITVGGVPWIAHDVDWDFDQGWFPFQLPTGKLAGNQQIEFTLERA